VFPGCQRPAAWCHNHIRHWVDGGETELDNGALVCHFHHDQIHQAAGESGWPRLAIPS